MIVFACHHVGGDLIDRAVSAAHEHMPDEPVLVVDSASPDRSYMDRVDAEIADVGNRNYATGAYLWAYRNRPADFYYLFHDGLIIRDDLTDLRSRDVTAVRWFQMPDTTWGTDRHGENLAVFGRTAYHGRWHERYAGVFGPMLACTPAVLADIDTRIGLPAANKWQECAMERLWGMALHDAGYDITDALQGQMHGFFDRYPSERVEKIHADRF